jgi:hypothetical protein
MRPDEIDPELVKLGRAKTKVGIVTALGLVILCIVFLLRLAPDRRFAASGVEPTRVAIADVLAGRVGLDALVVIPAEPLVSHAIRATKAKGSFGLRMVPARGTSERLWLVVSGDGWEAPSTAGYVGRLRKLDDLPFASAAHGYVAEHPLPVFATVAALRAGLPAGTVTTVTGDPITPAEGDAVALDTVDPTASILVASFNDRLPDAAAWLAALRKAGIAPTGNDPPDPAIGQVRFHVAAPPADIAAKLDTAAVWDRRIEPVTRHLATTWGVLRRSPASIDGKTLSDAQVELVALYSVRALPADAYALVTGEQPDDYWYVMPITIALAAILLVFAWALIRAVRRDLVPARGA